MSIGFCRISCVSFPLRFLRFKTIPYDDSELQGIAFIGAGMILNFQSIQTYVIDAFTLHAASGTSLGICCPALFQLICTILQTCINKQRSPLSPASDH